MDKRTNALFGLPPALTRNSLNNTMRSLGAYGLREQQGLGNSTPMKGNGWLGPLLRKDGGTSTELSAGFNIGGKQVQAPLMVPGLDTNELQWLLNTPNDAPDYFQQMPPSILEKAYKHAAMRLMANQSPFVD